MKLIKRQVGHMLREEFYNSTLQSAFLWFIKKKNKQCKGFCPMCKYYYRCQEDVVFEKNYGGKIKMMNGIDISNIQCKMDLKSACEHIEFVIMKASEGKNFCDKSFYKYAVQLTKLNKLMGCYHYCRPDNNKNPADEADNFINTVFKAGLIGKAILVADWEQDVSNPEWLISFCNEIMDRTGVRPFIYGSTNPLSKIYSIVGNTFPFWVAQWPTSGDIMIGTSPAKKGPNFVSEWRIWQHSSRGLVPGYGSFIDLDYTTMTKDEWLDACKIKSSKQEEVLSDDMQWAIKIGLFEGHNNGVFKPKEPLTREQAATLFKRYTQILKDIM